MQDLADEWQRRDVKLTEVLRPLQVAINNLRGEQSNADRQLKDAEREFANVSADAPELAPEWFWVAVPLLALMETAINYPVFMLFMPVPDIVVWIVAFGFSAFLALLAKWCGSFCRRRKWKEGTILALTVILFGVVPPVLAREAIVAKVLEDLKVELETSVVYYAGLGLAVIGLALSFFYGYFSTPLSEQYGRLRKEVRSARRRRAKLERRLNRMERAQARINAKRAELRNRYMRMATVQQQLYGSVAQSYARSYNEYANSKLLELPGNVVESSVPIPSALLASGGP